MTPIRLRVKELRAAKGLSQQALADLVRVRQATISELESGPRERIDLNVLDRLATALDVEPGDLLERVGKRPARKR